MENFFLSFDGPKARCAPESFHDGSERWPTFSRRRRKRTNHSDPGPTARIGHRDVV
ncbi:hypothetical protein ZHAS_00018552 [Anopheles sinensis]|uniref:Uncharacterized protein n=1 Tax=Anopheles sinensis TaxID=74873 RepID=A0A084WJW8_ANOSI|nr:hypothetical protein ZHAS_00018552 [Anopheles sinensis]